MITGFELYVSFGNSCFYDKFDSSILVFCRQEFDGHFSFQPKQGDKQNMKKIKLIFALAVASIFTQTPAFALLNRPFCAVPGLEYSNPNASMWCAATQAGADALSAYYGGTFYVGDLQEGHCYLEDANPSASICTAEEMAICNPNPI